VVEHAVWNCIEVPLLLQMEKEMEDEVSWIATIKLPLRRPASGGILPYLYSAINITTQMLNVSIIPHTYIISIILVLSSCSVQQKFLSPQSKSLTIHHCLPHMLALVIMIRNRKSIGTITRAINICTGEQYKNSYLLCGDEIFGR
jgi:hypothetical protein